MRIVFLGTGEIAAPTLRALVEAREHQVVGIVTQPDRAAGRSQTLTAPPIKAAAAGVGVEVYQPERIKAEAAVAWLQSMAPEVIVVMAYGQILPRSVLAVPRLACLNVHASLLPRHRGASCIQAAIAAGDDETGLTVIYMDEGLDTGDILLQSSTGISADETGGSLHGKLAEMAPELLLRSLNELGKGSAPRQPQRAELATYAPRLERDDGRIDWNEPAEIIQRKIRAYNPWPGSFTFLEKPDKTIVKLKVFRARICSTGEETLSWHGLVLEEVQLEGKRRMSRAELLRGNGWVAAAKVLH